MSTINTQSTGSSVAGPKVKGIADIVFLIDATASMQPCIDAVKDNIRAFIRTLGEADANGGRVVKDWRGKVVGYRDTEYDGEGWIVPAPFATDTQALESQLAGLRASGGGDTPESLLEAIKFVAEQQDWRSPKECRRFVCIFTDAPFKNEKILDDVINLVMAQKIILHIFAPAHYTQFNVLAEADKAQWHAGKGGSPMAGREEFAKIIEQLAKTITVEASTP